MHTVTVVFGDSQVNTWGFMFKEQDNAERHYTALAAIIGVDTATAEIQDDFGQKAKFSGKTARAVNIEDVDKTADASNQKMLAMAKGNARMEDIVQADTDPALKRAMQRTRQQQIQNRFLMGNGGMGPVPQA